MELAAKILEGNEGSAARLITMIEEGDAAGYEALCRLYPHTGRAHVIGITGSPGTGKSTLINKITLAFTKQGRKVGIVAVDPTSMKGRGALLGDRLRMKDADKVKGIFIRSMAHRGYPGGVSRAAPGAVYVMEALGKDIIIVESVGVGQTEMGITSFSDTVVSVLTPDYGDEIQLLKAGIMEVGDIIVVNKKDKPGSEVIACDAQCSMQEVGSDIASGWRIPVFLTDAVKGEGVEEVVSALGSHYQFLRESGRGQERRKAGRKTILLSLLRERLWNRFLAVAEKEGGMTEAMEKMDEGLIDPYTASEEVLQSPALRSRLPGPGI
jgi:LAO/AO transport system kinase